MKRVPLVKGNSIVSFIPSLLVTNICHLSNKIDELHGVVDVNGKPSVVMITESWLSSEIPDSAINIGSTYNIYRLDRPTTGGGVAAFIASNLPTTRLSGLEEK